jgi:hypothetical protein
LGLRIRVADSPRIKITRVGVVADDLAYERRRGPCVISTWIGHAHPFFERNTRGRDFAVGDIHGYVSALLAAPLELHFDPATDRLFSVAAPAYTYRTGAK